MKLDVTYIIGFVSLLIALGGFYLAVTKEIRDRNRTSQKDANERQDAIMQAVNNSKNEASSALKAQTSAIMDEVKEGRKTTDERLRELEIKSRDFMPRAEIMGSIEHLKANRVQAESQIIRIQENHSKQITALEVCMGKLEERHDGLNRDMSEVKGMLKDLASEMKAGFKEIAAKAA